MTIIQITSSSLINEGSGFTAYIVFLFFLDFQQIQVGQEVLSHAEKAPG